MKVPKSVLREEFGNLYFFHGSCHNWFMENFHVHDQHEILLVMSGGGSLEVEDRKYTMEDGDLFLLRSNERHRITGATNKHYERYVIQFHFNCFKSVSDALLYNFSMPFDPGYKDFTHKINLPQREIEKCIGFFRKVEHHVQDKNWEISVNQKLAIMELLVFINEAYNIFTFKGHGLNKDDAPHSETEYIITTKKYIDKIKKYVRANIEEELHLDNIAKALSMSKYYLSHCFKNETGFTLTQWVTKEKIARAMLLLKTGYSVAETAYKLSYLNDTYFISVFRKNCGITPKQYAKSCNSNNL